MPNNPRDSSNRVSKSAKKPVVSRQPSLTLEQALALVDNRSEDVTPTRDHHQAQSDNLEKTEDQLKNDIHQGSVANRTTASSSSSASSPSSSDSESESESRITAMITNPVPPRSNSREAPTLSDNRCPNAPDGIPAVKALQDWFLQSPIFKPNPHAPNSNKEQEDQEFKTTQTTFKQALMETDTKSFLAVLPIFSANPRAQVDLALLEILSAKLSQEGVWADIQSDPEFKRILDDGSNGTRLSVLMRYHKRQCDNEKTGLYWLSRPVTKQTGGSHRDEGGADYDG